VPDDGQGGHMVVRLDSGDGVDVPAEPSAPLDQAKIGQRVQIMDEVTAPGTPDTYIFWDYDRGVPLLILVAVFVAVVIAVARLKGLFALVGLGIAVVAVWKFTLPSLAVGHSPLKVALVTAAVVMFVVVYLAHGISVKTTTALLGTFAGVALVTALAAWAIPGTNLTPLQDETMSQIPSMLPGVDVRGVLLCGMVLAGVGVLNDVTVTQASSVWELRSAAPGSTRREIFTHAMRIGQDHIASTVYTIAFAYVGTSIGLLLLASRQDFSAGQLLTFNEIATPIVSTLVASVALVATIPVTTVLAAWLAGPAERALAA